MTVYKLICDHCKAPVLSLLETGAEVRALSYMNENTELESPAEVTGIKHLCPQLHEDVSSGHYAHFTLEVSRSE